MKETANLETRFIVTFPPINIEPLHAAVQLLAENLADSMDSVGCSELTLNSGDALRLQYDSTYSGTYRTLTINESGNLEDGVSLHSDTEYCVHGDPRHRVCPAEFRTGVDFLMRREEWIDALQNYCSSTNDLISMAISS